MKTEEVRCVYRTRFLILFLINSVLFFEMTSSGGNKESVYQEEITEWEKELKEVREQVGFFDWKEIKYFNSLLYKLINLISSV